LIEITKRKKKNQPYTRTINCKTLEFSSMLFVEEKKGNIGMNTKKINSNT